MTSKPNLTIDQAMALAAQLQSQGRLQESEQWLQKILQVKPAHSFALHLLGVIAHQIGKQAIAADLIRRAIAGKGDVALFHANLCEVLRLLDQTEMARSHGERAISLDPRMAAAHSNLGIVHYDRRDLALAEAAQNKALELAPGLPPALNNLGNICRERKQTDAAMAWYRKAIAANPHYLEPLSNLGALLLEEDRWQEAKDLLDRALALNPNFPEAVCNMGGVLSVEEHHDEALRYFHRALALRPNYVEAMLGMAKACLSKDRSLLAEAETYVLRALEIAPDQAKGHALLGAIYQDMDKPEQAEVCFRRALDIDPDCHEGLIGLGHLSMEQGRLEEAEALFQRILNTRPDDVSALIHLTQVKKVVGGAPHFSALVEANRKATGKSGARTLSLHYALGKGYEDLRDYDKAFPHFLEGARLKRARLPYDEKTTMKQFDLLTKIFNKTNLKRWRGAGDPSSLPIFVLGMPRSGTTLTEQIIASHPAVHGAGELDDLLRIAEQQTGDASAAAPFPENLRGLDKATLSAWGNDYIAGLQRRSPEARHITDKMPANFLAVGLIHRMLPNARIIHVNRNPVDTCVSCFTRLFNRKQEHTYDLAELGRYYVRYARLMDHWRRVLPPDAFLDIQYEDIVADQEGQARRLIAYCGLPWDDACLDFHKIRRPVRTASMTQVRQPIYRSSVERWRSYEAYLGPLLDALGDLASPQAKLI